MVTILEMPLFIRANSNTNISVSKSSQLLLVTIIILTNYYFTVSETKPVYSTK